MPPAQVTPQSMAKNGALLILVLLQPTLRNGEKITPMLLQSTLRGGGKVTLMWLFVGIPLDMHIGAF